jgi:hypothetical protein
MKKLIVLSFVAGFIFAATLLGLFRASNVVAQPPFYPGYESLSYGSTWVVRNEVWHDYRLSEKAEADGYKIRAAHVDMKGHYVSVLVSQ